MLKLLIPEPDSGGAVKWLKAYGQEDMVAPVLLPIEVASVLRQKLKSGVISETDCAEAISILDSLGITYEWDMQLLDRALIISHELSEWTVYDTLYLALAERHGCTLWTADARFATSASSRFDCVRLPTL